MYLTNPIFWIICWFALMPFYQFRIVQIKSLLLILLTLLVFFYWGGPESLVAGLLFAGTAYWFQNYRFISVLIFIPLVVFKIASTSMILIMPLGLSYFTLSLTDYVLKKTSLQNKVTIKDFFNYLPCALFFSTLTAGPILNIEDLKKKFESNNEWKREDILMGIIFIASGVLKKSIADFLQIEILTGAYEMQTNDIFLHWISFLTIGARFYADFSGMTDIALGLGRIFGFQLPSNFNLPFLTTNMSDYWAKWHMTLSNWARTYVFFPVMQVGLNFLGRRREFLITSISVFATMLFIGLWHRVTYLSLVWAIYNAFLILVTPRFDDFITKKLRNSFLILWPLNIFFIFTGFLFFTLDSIEEIQLFLRSLFIFEHQPIMLGRIIYCSLGLGVGLSLPHLLDYLIIRYSQKFYRIPVLAGFIIVVSLFWFFLGHPDQPFIYSRF